jgi:hypothetical protein
MYGDAVLRSRLIFRLDEPRPAPVCVYHDAAEEFETAFVIVGLTSEVGQELHATAHQPMDGVGAVLNQGFGEIWIDEVLSNAAKVVEISLRTVFAEIGSRDFRIAEIRYDPFYVVRAVMDHTEAATREFRIAASLLLGRAFQQRNFGSLFGGRQGRRQSGVAAANDDYIEGFLAHRPPLANCFIVWNAVLFCVRTGRVVACSTVKATSKTPLRGQAEPGPASAQVQRADVCQMLPASRASVVRPRSS